MSKTVLFKVTRGLWSFGRKLKIVLLNNVSIGNRVTIEKNVHFFTNQGGKVIIDNKASLLYGSAFFVEGKGVIKVGTNSQIGIYSVLHGNAGITIGKNVSLAPQVVIATQNHFSNYGMASGKDDLKPVSIGDGTWIGTNVLIIPGVKIGRRCIIGAGSVVTKDIPDNSIAVGSPAKVVKSVKK